MSQKAEQCEKKEQNKKEIKEQETPQEQEKTPRKKKVNEWEIKFNELNDKFSELNDTYLRALAEYDNYRKRTIKEKESMYADGIIKAIDSMLPVLDNLERALDSDQENSLKEGILMVKNQFVEALKGLGVTEIDCLEQVFDPARHNAIMHIDDDNYGENVIVEVFQKGYLYKDSIVIRHAVVKVAN